MLSGACQAPLLKIESDNRFTPKRVFDLNTDPDQEHDLFPLDTATYLSPSLQGKLAGCFLGYWQLNSNKNWTPASANWGTCPAGFQEPNRPAL
jgi:hypothetical protein